MSKLSSAIGMFREIRALPERLSATLISSKLSRRDENPVTGCYVTSSYPCDPLTIHEELRGGAVKLKYLAQAFPHTFPKCSFLYRVSSVHYRGALEVLRASRRKDIPVISNQNGIYYPAWFPGDFESMNRRLARLLDNSDFVIYQSDFCKKACERFLEFEQKPYSIVLNPVDTSEFVPCSAKAADERIVILTNWGNGYREPRARSAALGGLALMRKRDGIVVRFLGWNAASAADIKLRNEFDEAIKMEGIKTSSFEYIAPYSRSEAAAVFKSGDIFLHTAHNDPSPNVLGEALACGLPVVFSDSGGCREIVGEAGVGLGIQSSWEHESYPEPEQISSALIEVISHLSLLSKAARQRAESVLSVERFLSDHRRVLRQVGVKIEL